MHRTYMLQAHSPLCHTMLQAHAKHIRPDPVPHLYNVCSARPHTLACQAPRPATAHHACGAPRPATAHHACFYAARGPQFAAAMTTALRSALRPHAHAHANRRPNRALRASPIARRAGCPVQEGAARAVRVRLWHWRYAGWAHPGAHWRCAGWVHPGQATSAARACLLRVAAACSQ
jgi:hypothetical protein